jgi:hypothetical protein
MNNGGKGRRTGARRRCIGGCGNSSLRGQFGIVQQLRRDMLWVHGALRGHGRPVSLADGHPHVLSAERPGYQPMLSKISNKVIEIYRTISTKAITKLSA